MVLSKRDTPWFELRVGNVKIHQVQTNSIVTDDGKCSKEIERHRGIAIYVIQKLSKVYREDLVSNEIFPINVNINKEKRSEILCNIYSSAWK